MKLGKHWQSRLLASLLLCTVTSTGFTQPTTNDLPEMGDSSSTILSAEDEQRIGREMMGQLENNGVVLSDPIVEAYIQSIGHSLSSAAVSPQNHFRFFVVKAPSINAFAMPGGYIGVHQGLILASKSESELAAVLAHEIAHVTQHHIARGVEKANKMNMPLTAAVIAALILGGSDPQVANAALAASVGGAEQMQLDFTRANEKEADRVGMQLLSAADYDPRGMGKFFERLESETRYAGDGVPEFLRTHPVTVSRIAEAENRASLYPVHNRNDSIDYLLARARLRLYQHANSLDTLERTLQDEAPATAAEKEAHQYLKALVLDRKGQTDEARKLLAGLRRRHPNRIAYIHSLAGLEASQGNFQQANKLYQDGLKQYPGNSLLSLAYSGNLIEMKAYDAARSQLEQLLRKDADNLNAYRLLAQVESESGNKAAACLAQANYYYLKGEAHSALDQLNLAKRLTPLPHYYASRIDAKLKQIKDELALSEH